MKRMKWMRLLVDVSRMVESTWGRFVDGTMPSNMYWEGT